MRDLLAAFGLLAVLWTIIVRVCPNLAAWRSVELGAWAKATHFTHARIIWVWKKHWAEYRRALEIQ